MPSTTSRSWQFKQPAPQRKVEAAHTTHTSFDTASRAGGYAKKPAQPDSANLPLAYASSVATDHSPGLMPGAICYRSLRELKTTRYEKTNRRDEHDARRVLRSHGDER